VSALPVRPAAFTRSAAEIDRALARLKKMTPPAGDDPIIRIALVLMGAASVLSLKFVL
jgi:hypothetical protein